MRPDVREALRWLGAPNPTDELLQQVQDAADGLSATLQPKYTYKIYELDVGEDCVRLQGTAIRLPGSDARRMLAGCGRAALLACTLGSRFDAMLLSTQARDMAKAVILDALGSAFVEAGCDEAEQEIAARFPGWFLTDRFSPGYGDLPLDIQPALCAALDAQRRLGVTVTQSLLMNPVKSVTAIIGLSDAPQPGGLPTAHIRGCGHCAMRETCQFRKEGKTCGS